MEQFKSRHPLEGIIIPLSETTDDEMDEHIYAISEPAGFQQRDYIETEYWPKYASWISDDGTIEIREMTPPIDYGAKKREGLRAGIKRAKQGDGVFDSNPLGLPEEDGIWESEIRKELRRQKADAKLRDAWKDWDPMGPFRLGKGPVNCLPPQLGELRR